MTTQQVHQEVLIFINTTFSQQARNEKNNSRKGSTAMEDLEEAIWDGLLNELARELMPLITYPKMFIWGIRAGKYYLLIDLAESPGIPEALLSVDPDLFSSEINMN